MLEAVTATPSRAIVRVLFRLAFENDLEGMTPGGAEREQASSFSIARFVLLVSSTLRERSSAKPRAYDAAERRTRLSTGPAQLDRVTTRRTRESISVLVTYSRLSKRQSSKTVETVRCRHFLASLARAASACCTRSSASTPRMIRTGTSLLFANCTITSAIFRGSPSARPSRPRNILSIEPTEAS